MTGRPRVEAPPPHPGVLLLDWIVESGHTQIWLADQCDVSLKHINHIVRGRSMYSEELAITFGEVTDLGAQYWANLRSDWRLHLAQQKRRKRR